MNWFKWVKPQDHALSEIEREPLFEARGLLTVMKMLGQEEVMRARYLAQSEQKTHALGMESKLLGGKLTITLEFDPSKL